MPERPPESGLARVGTTAVGAVHDPPPCPICAGERTYAHRTDVEDFEYFIQPERRFVVRRCEDCRSQFLYPRPTLKELPAFYPPDYHAYNEDHGRVAALLVRLRARVRARDYRGLVGGGFGRLFDVGAGDCRHFDELRRSCALEFAGVELQPEIAARARARGYDVVEGMLETMDVADHVGRYDIISMNHVLEHVIDPGAAVERAYTLLKPGGHLVGQLPTVTSWEARLFGGCWGGYHFPRHLQMASRRGLVQLFRSHGFDEVRVKSVPHIQTAVSLQNTLVRSGWRPRMSYGKTPLYGFLLLAVLPFELMAFLLGASGIVDFEAHRPHDS